MATDPINPYAPPKSIQTPKSKVLTLIERATAYQGRVIYLGLALMIGALILSGMIPEKTGSLRFMAYGLSALGGIIFVVAVFLTLPLSIWGIIDGYREGRKNRQTAKHPHL